MSVLVVYATKTGCTRSIAERIGEDLRSDGLVVDVCAADDAPAPSGYDAVVAGSGIRGGQWHASARAWVEKNASSLKTMPVALYTCSLMITQAGKDAEVRAYTDPVIEASGVAPVDLGIFAGWFEPSKFGFAERSILKLMKTPQGDFRDWDAIDAWTEKVRPSLVG